MVWPFRVVRVLGSARLLVLLRFSIIQFTVPSLSSVLVRPAISRQGRCLSVFEVAPVRVFALGVVRWVAVIIVWVLKILVDCRTVFMPRGLAMWLSVMTTGCVFFAFLVVTRDNGF